MVLDKFRNNKVFFFFFPSPSIEKRNGKTRANIKRDIKRNIATRYTLVYEEKQREREREKKKKKKKEKNLPHIARILHKIEDTCTIIEQ